MIINLNTPTKVKLSEFGKVIWMSQIDSLPNNMKENQPELVQAIKNAVAADGTLELELWDIMRIFGQYISPANHPFATHTIEINRQPKFGKPS